MAFFTRRSRGPAGLLGCLLSLFVMFGIILISVVVVVVIVVVSQGAVTSGDTVPDSSSPSVVEGGWSNGD